jgi:nucleoside-diphosphate-sugar epimerase
LYGSDAAFWTLASLIRGKNGGVYNLGGGNPITHNCLASIIQDQLPNIVKVRNNTLCSQEGKGHDLFPDVRNTMVVLGVKETRTIEQAIRFTMDWFSIVQR